MVEKEERKNAADLIDLGKAGQFALADPDPIEIGLGYSISVKYDEDGKPLIYVKKFGDVDTRGLRREIERSYPGAAIQGLEKPKLIEVLSKEQEALKKTRSNTQKKEKSSV